MKDGTIELKCCGCGGCNEIQVHKVGGRHFITSIRFLLLTVRSGVMIVITIRSLNNVCKQVERFYISQACRPDVQPHATSTLVFSGRAATAD